DAVQVTVITSEVNILIKYSRRRLNGVGCCNLPAKHTAGRINGIEIAVVAAKQYITADMNRRTPNLACSREAPFQTTVIGIHGIHSAIIVTSIQVFVVHYTGR